MPVIGLLNSAALEAQAERLAAFQHGLKETGFVEGRNVTIDYRSAEGLTDQLPILARDLVRRQVSVLVATSTASALAAKRARHDSSKRTPQAGGLPHVQPAGGRVSRSLGQT
jgi:putative ABC transport system substrate-binding protein